MAIRIDITPLLKSVGSSINIDESEKVSYPEDGLTLVSPVHVTGTFTNSGNVILFKGKAETTARYICSRCLAEIDRPLKIEIEEEYKQRGVGRGEKNKGGRLKEEDFVFEVEPDNTIDLSEAIRQDLITELPIQPLCSENCKGVN